MFIKPKDVVTLDDNNEYVVVARANYKDNVYCYIVDINNNERFKFVYIDGDSLVEVTGGLLIRNLLPLFQNVSH